MMNNYKKIPVNLVNSQQKASRSFEDILPHNLDVEEEVIGGLLLDESAIAIVSEILIPEAFYVQAHQIIYKEILELFQQNEARSPTIIASVLQDKGLLEKVGGMPRLATLLERCVSAVNIDHHSELILDKYLKRSLVKTGGEIRELGLELTQKSEVLLDEAETKLHQLRGDRVGTGLTPVCDILFESFEDIAELHESGETPGVPTGFYDLDALTGGLQPSDLIIVAGRPSMGKTSFALNIAEHAARQGKITAVFSLEMSRQQLGLRLLSSATGIGSDRLRTGKIAQVDFDRISEALGKLAELPIEIDDTANVTTWQIKTQLRQLELRKGQDIGLVVLDYLQLMETGGDNRVTELAKITRAFKAIAREFKVPFVVLSQLSRAVESRNNKRPLLSDLRESGAIEQDADLVLMLYRDEYYNPDTPDPGLTEINVVKHRNGPTGTIKLLFEQERTKFLNIEQKGKFKGAFD